MKFSHGSHTLEVVWTILPAVTLLFIAIYQMNAWADAKMRQARHPGHGRNHRPAIQLGRPLSRAPTASCTRRTTSSAYDGDIHFPSGEEMLLIIKSADVLHSFFLPNLRMKQDVVPGMEQYMWFKARETGQCRHRVRRAVRLGPLQDERPRDVRAARASSTPG